MAEEVFVVLVVVYIAVAVVRGVPLSSSSEEINR